MCFLELVVSSLFIVSYCITLHFVVFSTWSWMCFLFCYSSQVSLFMQALTVLEYLVAHGSERVIDEIREHAYQISVIFHSIYLWIGYIVLDLLPFALFFFFLGYCLLVCCY